MIRSGTANDLYVSISRSIETKFREETGSFLMHFNCYLLVVDGHPATWRQILSAYLTYSVVGFFHCLLWTQKEKKKKRNSEPPCAAGPLHPNAGYTFVCWGRAKEKKNPLYRQHETETGRRPLHGKKKIQSIVQHICIDGRVLSWLAIKVNQSGGSLLFNSRYESKKKKKKKIHKKKRHANRECIG